MVFLVYCLLFYGLEIQFLRSVAITITDTAFFFYIIRVLNVCALSCIRMWMVNGVSWLHQIKK